MPLKARPTVYNGIQMRSRLEARVAAWLDSLGIGWAYEPHAFASADGQYLPDFELDTTGLRFRRRMYLEVKGNLAFRELMDMQSWMAAIVSASDPKAILLIADARMLEFGYAAAYNFPDLGKWDDELLVDVFTHTGLVELCDHWRLSPWEPR